MPMITCARQKRTQLLKWMIIRAVPLLNTFRPRSAWQHSLEELRHFPPNTWGAELATFLDARRFSDFLTNYEAHDAFHTLLDYDTNVIGELRLQAFMVGNRSASFAGRVLLGAGLLILPELWPQLGYDMSRGRQSDCVGQWRVPTLLSCNIAPLQARIAKRVDVLSTFS